MKTGIHRPLHQDAISFGLPWSHVVPSEIERLGVRHVFVLASTTYANRSGLEARLHAALGDRLAGFFTGIRAHTPREDVVAAADRARESGADFVLAIGGGSVIDAAKILLLCLACDVREAARLDELVHTRRPQLPGKLPVRMGAVPTTLSGAEFTFFGGATDTMRKVKQGYVHPLLLPRFVVLDPAVTVHTPQDLWLSTGMRAVDHAVESLCSPGAQPMSNAASLEALRLLPRSLLRTHEAPDDLDARLESLCGVWLATAGLQGSVPMGASHGIGHALGGVAGVPHGVTSCLMLPHVLRWNKTVNSDRQARIGDAMGEPGADAGDTVARLVSRLGLPGRLRDAGVSREQFATIATHAMHDPWTLANPRPLGGEADVLALLESAW